MVLMCMLSGETAAGNYQFKKMTQIIEAVENSPLIQVHKILLKLKTKRFITKTICRHGSYG
jgi:pyruvate kinase